MDIWWAQKAGRRGSSPFPFRTHLIGPEWFPQVCLSPLTMRSPLCWHQHSQHSLGMRLSFHGKVSPKLCHQTSTALPVLSLPPTHHVLLLRDQQQDAPLWRESGTQPRGNCWEADVGPENAGGDPKPATIPHPAGACGWGSGWGPGTYVSSIPGQHSLCLLSLWDQEKRTGQYMVNN